MIEVEVRQPLVSPAHRFAGRPADGPAPGPSDERVRRIGSLVGAAVALDRGTGSVPFAGRRPARPCAWLDVTVAPGAQRARRGGGGVRCAPLGDGTLTVGPARLWMGDG
ncbi:hypothetical protein AB0G32_21425 [Streptomyces sp. NPDC023723]|uniref:hypothetical protein n=1 Tax=Streptomyces sp. NPDC023723 TaxID=3154323 RepID=UPI0033C81E29